MNNASVHRPVQRNPRAPRFWIVVAAIVVLLVLLLVFAPLLVLLLSLAVLVVGLLALVIGRIRWARIPNRRFAGGVAGGSFALLLVSLVVFGLSLPTETIENPPVAGIVAPAAAAEEATLASFVGQACEADHLVMTQGNESNYCNEDATGAFVWMDQTNHDQATAQAKEMADKKAAAKIAAEEKSAAEAKAKKEAEQKAAAKKAAEEKSAAEAKAKAKKEAERKAAAAEAEAKRAAAAAEAERQAEAESMVEDSAGSSAYYENCSAVRAAGAAPIYSGDPGYSRKLDRDGDGVGCEN